MDLAFEARIALRWRAEGEVAEAVRAFADVIAEQTLASRFEEGAEGEGQLHETKVEGQAFDFRIAVA